MKRYGWSILAAILVLMVAFGAMCAASADGIHWQYAYPTPTPTPRPTPVPYSIWPSFDLTFDLRWVHQPDDAPYQAYAGPGRDYARAGKFKATLQVDGVYYRENGYVYCEVQYGQDKRRMYLSEANFTDDLWRIPSGELTGCLAITNSDVIPRFGPGRRDDVPGWYKKVEDYAIDEGTWVTVFCEDYSATGEAWLFCQFETAKGTVRAWIPASQVRVF